MKTQIKMDAIYVASNNVVVREVENSTVIIPIAFETDDTEDQPYTLNATGQLIWRRLNGETNLKIIIADLATEFKMPIKLIEKDVTTFLKKLMKMKMIVEISPT